MRPTWLFVALFLLMAGISGPLQAYTPIYTPRKTISPTDVVAGQYQPPPMVVTGLTPSGGVAGYFSYVQSHNGTATPHTQGFYWDDAAQRLISFGSAVLGSPSNSMATCVNQAGAVAGIYWSVNFGGQQLGFLYQNGSVSTITSPTAGDIDSVVAINAGGQVIGTYFGDAGLKRGFLWSGGDCFDLGDLGDPDNSFVWPQAINDAGQVVGTIYTPGGQVNGLTSTAFQWVGGTFSALTGTEDYAKSSALGINGLGEITGTYAVPSTTHTNSFNNGGFYWFNDALTDLGSFGGSNTVPFFIDDDGVITGTAYDPGNLLHLFNWQAGVFGDLGVANLNASDQSFEITGVNRSGDVTGFVTNAGGVDQAFLRTQGTNYNLAALVPGSIGFTADGSNGTRLLINDDELIAASGFSQGAPVVMLLTPDADGNGLPDGWEQYYFGHHPVDATATLAWNGNLTVLQAYQLGINPADFYDGHGPTLTKTGGDGQPGAPGEFLPLPLTVSVASSSGQPLIGAPVTFAVTQSDGAVQRSSNSPPVQTVTVLTDYNGQAKVYYRLSSQPNVANQITASPGSGGYTNTQTFTENAQGVAGTNPSPFAPSNVVATMNRDGSADVSWTNNADPTDTEPIDIRYKDRNGVWQVLTTVDGQATSYHIPAP